MAAFKENGGATVKDEHWVKFPTNQMKLLGQFKRWEVDYKILHRKFRDA